MKKYNKLVLIEYHNAGSYLYRVQSDSSASLSRIVDYFTDFDGFDSDRDSLTIMGEIMDIDLDKPAE